MPHPLCGTPVSGFIPRCSTMDWDKTSQYLNFADLSRDLSLNEKLSRHKFFIANSVACPESFSSKISSCFLFYSPGKTNLILPKYAWHIELKFEKTLEEFQYCKVTSSNTTCLKARAGFFRLLMHEGDFQSLCTVTFGQKDNSSSGLVTCIRTGYYKHFNLVMIFPDVIMGWYYDILGRKFDMIICKPMTAYSWPW